MAIATSRKFNLTLWTKPSSYTPPPFWSLIDGDQKAERAWDFHKGHDAWFAFEVCDREVALNARFYLTWSKRAVFDAELKMVFDCDPLWDENHAMRRVGMANALDWVLGQQLTFALSRTVIPQDFLPTPSRPFDPGMSLFEFVTANVRSRVGSYRAGNQTTGKTLIEVFQEEERKKQAAVMLAEREFRRLKLELDVAQRRYLSLSQDRYPESQPYVYQDPNAVIKRMEVRKEIVKAVPVNPIKPPPRKFDL